MSDGSPSSPKNGSIPAAPAPPLNHHFPPFENASTPPPRGRKKPKIKESIIDHTYRDFSRVKVDDEAGEDDKAKNRPNFPAKLHAIVSNPNYQHIICWLPHGRSWKIVDKYLLTSVIIPQHFAHAKFESFNRSVNGWGFKRLLNPGPDCKSYYHECFLRGRPELTKMMQRLVNPGKRLPDKSGEPDFYEISKSFPLPQSLPPVLPSGISMELKAPAALTSPNAHHPGGQPMFTSPQPPHANGYNMYGYPQATPQFSMPSPAANQGTNHLQQQQQQQMYWPNQVGSPQFQPNPSPYGYYPYPPQMQQMMMMAPQAGPQGYYMVQQPYQQPALQNQYFPPTPTAAATPQATGPTTAASQGMMQLAATSADTPDSAIKSEDSKQDVKPVGTASVASDATNNTEPEWMKPAAQTESDEEAEDEDNDPTVSV
eukprot:CAMPEP_0201994892 /NCGR_PEP_ID=MMETSP0905-20130828/2573_1 /ASSEMBLY_ACC=CAM_ASM_000554 /TAXON_ID=420261 /ORGANISM="Thalassiosira antarctica, Strain CCMP982" /LENGTH=426 /DNA_ID=CAMNT_0048549939 /DNA_START=177 /DNA_END=1457 /DNA_ORIENTATION=-